jgi:CHAT domain-containing protein
VNAAVNRTIEPPLRGDTKIRAEGSTCHFSGRQSIRYHRRQSDRVHHQVTAMFLSFSLAVLLAAVPPELEPVIGSFVDGFRRHDHYAIRGRRPLRHHLGTSYDRLRLHDDVDITSWRIVSAEPAEEGLFLTVEMEGTATAEYTGERVRWPRRWSMHVVQVEGAWAVDTAMVTERRLAEGHWQDPAELRRLLDEDPALDFAALMRFVEDFAEAREADPGVARSTLLWMVREAEVRGQPAVLSLAYRGLSSLARLADPAEALAMAEQSLRHAEASGDAEAISYAHYYLGSAHAAAGRIDAAVAALRRAATYFGRALDPRAAKDAMNDATRLELGRANLRAALADAERAGTMLGPFSSKSEHMNAAFRIAEIHERLGNSEIALRHYEEARRFAHADRSPEGQLTTAWKVALQERALGNAERARWTFEDARGLYQYLAELEPMVQNQTSLAALQLDLGEAAESERSLEEALAVIAANVIPPQFVADVYLQRSRLRLVQGRPEEALADARLAREQAAGGSRAEALTAEGRALRWLSRNTDAEEVLRAAIDLVEVELSQLPVDETGGATLLAAKLAPYRELLDLLVEQGCAREALTVAERMRARSLRETLEHGRVDLSAGLDAAQRERERALEQALADVNRKLLAAGGTAGKARLQQERDDTRLALRQFRSELSAAHPQLDRRRPEGASHGELLLPSIAPGELVLELAVLEHALIVFALRKSEVTVSRIAVSRDRLERQIGAFVTALEQRDLGYTKDARALYDLLLRPVAEQLRAATSLRIVPDGALWRLPFHALVDGRGRHLVGRMPVAYSPSLAMTRTPVAAGPRRTLLAFGDPVILAETAQATRSVYRDVTLGRLPEAAEEARAIARLYRDAHVRIGADAREAAFKDDAPAYRVLHLAAHSIVDDRTPMFSSIVLSASGDNPLEDGLLEAREIAGLDLRADLAVLSACETARGAVTAGEGMVGLSWAFLAAGVPTTVVSQWKVGSASTAALMIEFHRRLRGGRTAAEALRAAMLELRRDPRWRHPFYWAPFTAIENSGIPSERR